MSRACQGESVILAACWTGPAVLVLHPQLFVVKVEVVKIKAKTEGLCFEL